MKPYSCPYKHKEIICHEIEKLKEADLIRPAKMSQWGFHAVLVYKPHSNKMKMCNDVRELNDKTILQPYPMLNMNYLLAHLYTWKCPGDTTRNPIDYNTINQRFRNSLSCRSYPGGGGRLC